MTEIMKPYSWASSLVWYVMIALLLSLSTPAPAVNSIASTFPNREIIGSNVRCVTEFERFESFTQVLRLKIKMWNVKTFNIFIFCYNGALTWYNGISIPWNCIILPSYKMYEYRTICNASIGLCIDDITPISRPAYTLGLSCICFCHLSLVRPEANDRENCIVWNMWSRTS